MGTILQAACSKCGYSTRLFTGSGLADCERKTAITAAWYDENLAAALKECTWFEIQRRAAVCDKCKKLTIAADITYRHTENGPQIYARGVCPDCGGELTPLSQKDKQISCPVCKSRITLTRAGHWD